MYRLAGALILACGLTGGAAAEEKAALDAAVFAEALATAAHYARDEALLFFCARNDPSTLQLLKQNFLKDQQDARTILRIAGASRLQWQQVAAAIKENSGDPRDVPPARCAAEKILDQAFTISGVGTPLPLRPPFRAMKAP